ncbi:MAG: hypothetical protein IPF99_07865 [Deltaproteobacteria bacterium]|nr:hypothetical protein [Deltaproteobacteria bacterium]
MLAGLGDELDEPHELLLRRWPFGEDEGRERLAEVSRRLVALRGVGVQPAVEHRQERLREPRPYARGVFDEPAADALEQQRQRRVGEGRLPQRELVEHGGGGEDVAAGVDGVASHLLGREVRVLALDDAGLRGRRAVGGAREAEVRELHLAVVREQDVGGRDVAVDDAQRLVVGVRGAVRVLQALAELPGDERRDLRRGQRVQGLEALEELPEVEPVDVLHRDVVAPLDLAEVDDLDDVAMAQPRGEARFIDEPPGGLRVAGHASGHHLEGDVLLEARDRAGPREEHLGRASACDPPHDLVGPERSGQLPCAQLTSRGL